MKSATIIGIVLLILIITTSTAFVFSKIQIEPVFIKQTSGNTALETVNYTNHSLLDVIIDAINPFK